MTIAANMPASQRSWWWLYLLLAFPVLGVTLFVLWRPIVVLPRIALAPGYALRDQQGEIVTSEDRRGRLTLYSFSYTGCAEGCPQSLASLARLAQALPESIDLVTINLAPAQPAGQAIAWPFLTGEALLIRQVVGAGFDVYFRPEPEGGVYFEPRFVLVDKAGIIRAFYHTNAPDLKLIGRDIDYLLAEEKNSQGLATVGYEAAHLFLCYPR